MNVQRMWNLISRNGVHHYLCGLCGHTGNGFPDPELCRRDFEDRHICAPCPVCTRWVHLMAGLVLAPHRNPLDEDCSAGERGADF